MELTGKVLRIMDPQTFDSGFTKREMVIETQENYPQKILIEFLQDRINLLDSLNEGEEVRVSINIRGREWVNPQGETKYFNSITGWRVEKMQAQFPNTSASQMPPAPPVVESFSDDMKTTEEEEDDLPF